MTIISTMKQAEADVRRANPLTGRPGPAPAPARDGDKIQARQRVNVEVRTGRRPHPNTLPCTDCGHIWSATERHHEYDHHLGYAAEHHFRVEPVCTTCHHRRDNRRAKQTECLRGHPFSPENTFLHPNGTRHCRECRRLCDRRRRGKHIGSPAGDIAHRITEGKPL